MELTGSAEVLIKDEKLLPRYEYEVLQSAIDNALYQAFGSSVSSSYEKRSETTMEGRKVISHSDANSRYISTFPNGIWKSHKRDPEYTTYKDQKGNWWLKCDVNGYGKKQFSNPVEFIAKTLDGTDKKTDQTTSYMSGEHAYFYFRSGEDGYLLIFFDDFETIQRGFPYNAMDDDVYPVKGNTDYILFSKDHAFYLENKLIVDEIEFFTNKSLEYNLLYVVFSPSPIRPPVLNDENELANGYETFKYVDRNKFHRWLQNQRLSNERLQVEILGITIYSSD